MGVPPGNRRGSDLRRTCSVRRKVRDPRTPGRTARSAVAAGASCITRVTRPEADSASPRGLSGPSRTQGRRERLLLLPYGSVEVLEMLRRANHDKMGLPPHISKIPCPVHRDCRELQFLVAAHDKIHYVTPVFCEHRSARVQVPVPEFCACAEKQGWRCANAGSPR